MKVSKYSDTVQILWLAITVIMHYNPSNTELLFIVNHFINKAFTGVINIESFLQLLNSSGITNILNVTLYYPDNNDNGANSINQLPPSFLTKMETSSSSSSSSSYLTKIMISTISLGLLLSAAISTHIWKRYRNNTTNNNNHNPAHIEIESCSSMSMSTLPLSPPPLYQDELQLDYSVNNTTTNNSCLDYSLSVDASHQIMDNCDDETENDHHVNISTISNVSNNMDNVLHINSNPVTDIDRHRHHGNIKCNNAFEHLWKEEY